MPDFRLTVFIPFFIVSCGDIAVPPLAKIERVEPETLEPGEVLRIHGTGFVEGTVDVILEGSMKASELGSLRSGSSEPDSGVLRRIRLNGIAVSENVIEIPLSEQTLRQFVEEPSVFLGAIEADFDIAGSIPIFAKQPDIQLEFNPGGAGVKSRARKIREAEAALKAVGIRLVGAAEVEGLIVAETIPGSPADKAGIEFGDRLLSVDTHSLVEVSDFACVGRAANHVFEVVTREGLVKTVSVGPPMSEYLDQDELFAVILSSIAFGLFLALAAPSAKRFRLLPTPRRDPFIRAIVVGLFSLFLCLIPATILFVYGGPLIWVLLFGGHAASVIALHLMSKNRSHLSLLRLALIPAQVAVCAYLCSALGPIEMVALEQQSPLGLLALANPFIAVSAALALFLIWPPLENSERQSSVSSYLSLPSAVFSASALTLCLFGGWSVPFIFNRTPSDDALIRASACVVFMLKTWSVAAVSFRLSLFSQGSRRNSSRRALVVKPMLLIACCTAGIIWNAAKISSGVQIAGQVLATSMFTAAISYYIAMELKGFLGKREISAVEARAQGSLQA
jgi:hypothetical protein